MPSPSSAVGRIAVALGTARKIGFNGILGPEGNRCRDLILALPVSTEAASKLATARALSPATTASSLGEVRGQGRQGQPAGEVTATVIRRTVASTSRARVLLAGDNRFDFNDGQLSPATCACFANSHWTLSALRRPPCTLGTKQFLPSAPPP